MTYGKVLANFIERFKEIKEREVEPTIAGIFEQRNLLNDLYVSIGKFHRKTNMSNTFQCNYETEKIYRRSLELKIEIELEIKKLKSIKLIDTKAKTRDIVYVGKAYLDIGYSVRNFIDKFSEKMRGLKGLKNIYYNVEKSDISKFGDMDKSQLLNVLHDLIVLVADYGQRTERKNRAMFDLHHESQIDPVTLQKIMYELGLGYVDRDIMRMSSKHFLKSNNLPEWVMNVELNQKENTNAKL